MGQRLDMEETVAWTGLEYFSVGQEDFPRGWMPDFEATPGSLHGRAVSRYTLQAVEVGIAATPRNAAKIQGLCPDLLIVDQFFWPGLKGGVAREPLTIKGS